MCAAIFRKYGGPDLKTRHTQKNESKKRDVTTHAPQLNNMGLLCSKGNVELSPLAKQDVAKKLGVDVDKIVRT